MFTMILQKILPIFFIFILGSIYSQSTWYSNLVPQVDQLHPEFGGFDEGWPIENIELIQYRRENAKTFVDIENVYHTLTSGGNLHYYVGSQLFNIQQNPTQSLNRFGIFKSDLPLYTNLIDGTTSLQLHPVGGSFSLGSSKSISHLDANNILINENLIQNNGVSSVNGNKLFLSTTSPGIKSTFEYNYSSFRFNLEFDSPTIVPPTSQTTVFTQSYSLPSDYQLTYDQGEMTEYGWFGSLKITDFSGNVYGTISPAQIFDSFSSEDKNDAANHVIPGYYKLVQTENGYFIEIHFDSDFLRRNDLVYPVIIDPTVSNTYAGNRAVQDKNTQFNANCQQPLTVNIPITGFQVTGSATTYRIWAKGYIAQSGSTTYYADKIEQRSRVGCGTTWTPTQSGTGFLHNGSAYAYTSANNGITYNLTNQSMCNGCYPNQNSLTYIWQGYQTYFPVNVTAATNIAGCVTNYQELVTNTWQVTTTYVALPYVDPINNQTVCAGSPTSLISFTGNATTYSWTNSNTAIGLPASGNGNINVFNATNVTSTPITATITVTPLNNPCSGPPVTFTITVNPSPTVTNPGNQTICPGQATSAINFSGTSGATFNWVNDNTSTGLTSINGSNSILSFNGLNSGTTNNVSTITVTPSLGTCSGIPVTFTITISPLPTVTNPLNQTVCNGQSTTAIVFSGNATTYSWVNDNTTTGLAANGTGNIASFVATNSTNSTITSTITVTPISGSCSGIPISFSISVSPAPTVSSPPNQNACAGQQTTPINFSGTATTYNWTNNNTSIGLGLSGNGSVPAFTATNTTSNPITANLVVTPSANGCVGAPVNFTITVNSSPTVNAGGDISICAGNTAVLNGSGSGTPSWNNGGTLSSTTLFNPTASPLTTTTYTLTITQGVCTASDNVVVSIIPVSPLTLTPNQSICNGDCTTLTASGADFYEWGAHPDLTDLSLASQTVCPTSTTTYSITGYTVGTNLITNGDFSIGNIGFSSDYLFTSPTNTTEGQYTVIGTPATFNGGFSACGDHTTGSGNMLIVNGTDVLGASVWCQTITVTPNTDYLFSAWLASVFSMNPAELQFTINGIPIGLNLNASANTCIWEEFFSTWNSGTATTANICITNLNLNLDGNDFALDDISFAPVCEQQASVTVSINSEITPTFNTYGPFCQDAILAQVILPQTSNNGITGTWNPAMLSTTTPGINNYTFTPDPGQCASSTSLSVTINPLLIPTFAAIPALCQNIAPPSLPATSTNSISGSWNPATINTNTIGTSTYTFTPGNGQCATPTTLDVLINTPSTPLFTTNLTQGCAPLNVQLSITNPSPNVTYSWSINGVSAGNGSTISSTLISEACYDISVQSNDNGCVGTTTLNDLICVQEIPLVNFTASPNQITNTSQTVNFSNTGINSLSYSWLFGDGQSSTDYSPTHFYTNVTGGMYVTLTGSTSFGCVGTASMVIPFKEEGDFYVPNTFTPDGDEFNQNWLPIFTRGFDPFNFNVYIFDRWGELIWENHDYRIGWDGTNNIEGRKAPDGVYIWRIEYKPVENDKKNVVMGHVTLLR